MTPFDSALAAFCREPGRSAYAEIDGPLGHWSGGVDAGAPRPAASLLKVPLAMAVEPLVDDLTPQRVRDLLDRPGDASVLHVLSPDRMLSPSEMLGLMLAASDAPCARWAARSVGLDAVRAVLTSVGAESTTCVADPEFGLLGQTTAFEAIRLLQAACNARRYPVSASALENSIVNSRIPLGATEEDVTVAHKTGTLGGVANDVARLTCDAGEVWLAFLSDDQHDTLVTGYEMGVCARALLEAAGLRLERTVGVL